MTVKCEPPRPALELALQQHVEVGSRLASYGGHTNYIYGLHLIDGVSLASSINTCMEWAEMNDEKNLW